MCFDDVDGGSLGGCVKGVPRRDVYFHSGGVEVRGGRAADEWIKLEGRDWVLGAPRCWGHGWHGSRFAVAFVGGKGLEGGGDDVLGLSLQDNLALCAEVSW